MGIHIYKVYTRWSCLKSIRAHRAAGLCFALRMVLGSLLGFLIFFLGLLRRDNTLFVGQGGERTEERKRERLIQASASNEWRVDIYLNTQIK